MRNRIKRWLAAGLAGVLLLGGCSSREDGLAEGMSGRQESKQAAGSDGSERVMGRFIGQQVTLPGESAQPVGLKQNGERLRLADGSGMDMISEDGGESFQYDEGAVSDYWEQQTEFSYIHTMEALWDGSRMVVTMDQQENETGDFQYYVISAEGEKHEVASLSGRMGEIYSGEDGCFYFADYEDDGIYQIDPVTGDASLLFQADGGVAYLAAAGTYLYVLTGEGVQLYDLASRELSKEDTVLSQFLKDSYEESYMNQYPTVMILGAEEGSIYVLDRSGLYRHTVYGSAMEQMIDGSLCSIGDVTRSFAGLAAVKQNGEDIFYILYSDGSLMRFVYDPDIPSVPDTTLRVYGLYEDDNIRQAVSGFQQLHPEIYVTYEVGVTKESGETREDALKNLGTLLAAGKGPDVIVMDDVPYESYVEKGVLEDLTEVLSQLPEDALFEQVVEGYEREGGLYTVPMHFSIPVIAGGKSILQDSQSLAQLAENLQNYRQEHPEGMLLNFGDARGLLELFANMVSGDFVEGKKLNRAAITDFLTACKIIYDAQMAGASQQQLQTFQEMVFAEVSETGSRVSKNHDISSTVSGAYYLGQPAAAGLLSGSATSYAFFCSTLRVMDFSWRPLCGSDTRAAAASLLSVNRAGTQKETAYEFIQYALSETFQATAYLSGIPINKAGYEQQKQSPFGEAESFGATSIASEDGSSKVVEIFWPDEEEFAYLDQVIEGVQPGTVCERNVYEAVTELGQKAVTGELTVEETVNEIEKKVQLYLAE